MWFVFLYLRAEDLSCSCSICHCSFQGCPCAPHQLSHRATQTFIHNVSCLHSPLLGSCTICFLLHSHLISAFLFKCSFIYCGAKRKHPQSKVIAERKEALSGFVIPAHSVSFSACLYLKVVPKNPQSGTLGVSQFII